MEPVSNARMKWLCRAQSWELLVASRVKVILTFGEFCCLNIQSTVPGWWSTDDLGGASILQKSWEDPGSRWFSKTSSGLACCMCLYVCVCVWVHACTHACVCQVIGTGNISMHKIKRISFGYNNLFKNDNNRTWARNKLKNRKEKLTNPFFPSLSLPLSLPPNFPFCCLSQRIFI